MYHSISVSHDQLQSDFDSQLHKMCEPAVLLIVSSVALVNIQYYGVVILYC